MSNRQIAPESELAWAAGLYDGEGCTAYGPRQLYATMSQRSPEVLERFAAAVGMGAVRGYTRPDGNPVFHWKVSGLSYVQAILGKLWPYLGEVKKTQARMATFGLCLGNPPSRFPTGFSS